MGGNSSREKSKKRFNERKKRDNVQWSKERGVLPVEHVSGNVSNIDTAYKSSRTSCTPPSILQDHSNIEDISQDFDSKRDSYSRNDIHSNQSDWDTCDDIGRFGLSSENINSLNFVDEGYQERQFRRPVRRHQSFNENRFQFMNDEDNIRDYRSIRCNSMNDLRDRGFPFEGRYMEYRLTHCSNQDLPNCTFPRRNSNASDRYDGEVRMGRGGIKRSTWGDVGQDVSWDNRASNDWGDSNYVLDSPAKPLVKRRQSDESHSGKAFSGEYNCRNENERCNSGLSYDSSTTSSSNSADLRASERSKVMSGIPNSSDENNGALDILSFPSEWSSFAVDKTGYVNIPLSSSEGESIEKFFIRTNKSCLFITGIVRIENPFLHTLYLLKKEEMAIRNGHVDELFLYHGTKKRFVTKICENNLDWRQYSDMHRFGKGVSFSPSATYSSHYSDDKASSKILILFKVLVSNCIEGSSEMEIPPNDDGNSYDTSIKEDASVIVKYNDNEFYPLYKIIYKKK